MNVVSLALSVCAVGMCIVATFDLHAPLELGLVALVVALTIAGVANWFPVRYGRYLIDGDTLVVRRQWQTRRIPLASITEVRRPQRVSMVADWEDDFALGGEVLEIRYGGGAVPLPPPAAMKSPAAKAYVSPRDEAAFLSAIGHRLREDV